MTILNFPNSPVDGQEYEGYIYNATKGTWDSAGTAGITLNDMSDVDTTGVQDGNALVYDLATSQWIPGEGGGGGSYTISATAPVSPEEGDVWFNSTNARSYIYYVDVDSSQWVEIAGAEGAPGTPASLGDIPDVDVAAVQDGNALIYDAASSTWIPGEGGGKFTVADTAPAPAEGGDVWFNSNTGKTYIYYADYDSDQWVEIASNTTGYLDIGQLNDVAIVNPINGQSLTYEDGDWVNSTPASNVSDLTDTEIYEPTDGQALVYDSATDRWVNENIEIPPGTTISATAPVSPEQGQLWWDSDNGNLYIYYDDGSGAQWVAANGPQVFVGTAPPAGYQGQLWLDSTQGKTYIYYDDGTSAQWISAIGGSLSGNVVSAYNVNKTNLFSTSSTTYVTITDLSITLVPKSTSSRFLLLFASEAFQNTNGQFIAATFFKDSTQLFDGLATTFSSNASYYLPIVVNYMDSPSTTNSITYTVRARAGSGTASFSRGSFTVLEIAG